jgi:hypothetical protein
MAKARIKLVCEVCGKEYWVEKTCYNRKEANSWEQWMASAGGNRCKECYAADKAAERAEKQKKQLIGIEAWEQELELPALSGSDKQIAWARNIRYEALGKAIGGEYIKGYMIKDNWAIQAKAQGIDASAAKCVRAALENLIKVAANNSAKWWIDNRQAPRFSSSDIIDAAQEILEKEESVKKVAYDKPFLVQKNTKRQHNAMCREICLNAWVLIRQGMSKSDAFKAAWKIAKEGNE